ncbi:hypothetical protein V2G26_004124 [Clonostachys chloroleuca]
MNLLLKICLRPSPRANVFYALVEAYQDAWAEQSESGTTSWASQRDMNDNVPLAFFIWLWEWVGNDGSEAASRFEQIRVGLRYCLHSYFDDLFAAIEAFAPPEDSGHNCATMLETNSGTEPKSLNLGVWANQTVGRWSKVRDILEMRNPISQGLLSKICPSASLIRRSFLGSYPRLTKTRSKEFL